MAIKAFKRFEKKFILNESQYKSLLPILYKYMNPDKYCKDGNNYNIYSIYYDTDDNQVIRHSINKPYYKEKLRLRSYKAPIDENGKVFLELKKKINGIVSKRRATLTLEEAEIFLESRVRPDSIDYLNNQVLDELEYYLEKNNVSPKVFISYSRKALFGKNDQNFRITFDSNILSRRDNLSLKMGGYGKELLPKGYYLMEVKILGAMPVWLTKTLSELKIYNTHFSKYGNEYMGYCLNNTYDIRRKNIC
ncbi:MULTISPECIES: polyphosphate polymerase domain-containing protein [unclassified Clostridium]|uniref:polyphosphate polymerase domain-containing protein n=1 Tax=unclassified Clostridium TaxID=2614128 RepID=UPI0025FF511F|nr:polyphosphate polymerase domain-containing protein [Clostridium sp.]MCI6691930.1 polyphosphate polymerase domain-containing protein [Clostridium sp.]MDY4252833.1 polyphosphate polymerase domain-containing protein [Clostridium sp.]MDY6226148.1 polyphosphate polymerase domain-containing protein [Clostridium sp.]